MELRLAERRMTWHEVGGDVVVLDLDGSVYLKLNGTGRVLWELLAEGTDQEHLRAALVENYDVDPATAATDVDEFIGDLRRRELLAG